MLGLSNRQLSRKVAKNAKNTIVYLENPEKEFKLAASVNCNLIEKQP
jgi:hypothetical protein